MPVQTVIKVRRDTAANWISTNPTLAAGEMGLETDTNLFKFGNGTSAWTALAYSSSSRTTQIAKNDTGASAAKGSVVYISGANGANALFSLADADAEVTSSKTVGLLAQTLATNGIGAIVTEGLLSGINTGTATAGQSVWLSSTAGEFVFNAPPAKPAHSVYLGVVTRAHATEGEILVKVQNGYELEELHNVSIASVANKQVLQYDSANSLWKNATISAGVTVSDTAPASPSVGDQWYNSVEGRTYVYYDSFWVDSNPGLVGPAGADGTNGTNGTNGTDGGFNSTQTIAALASGVTLSSVDVGKLFTGGGATVTVQGLSVGQQVDFVQTSASQITFAAGSGMTLNSKGGLLKTAAQYSPATIKCIGTNSYVLLGDLGA